MHSHGVCSRTEGGLGGAHISQQELAAGLWEGIYWMKLFSYCTWSWILEMDLPHLQFDAITPTALRAETSSDTSVPTSDGLGLVFLLIWSSSSSLARGHSCPEVLTHTCAGMCSFMSQHTRKGKFMFSTQPFIPASLTSLKTHQFQVSKAAPGGFPVWKKVLQSLSSMEMSQAVISELLFGDWLCCRSSCSVGSLRV